MTKKIFYVAIVAMAIAAVLGVSRPGHSARKPAAAAIRREVAAAYCR